MAHELLDGENVYAFFQKAGGKGVPLRYNKDKSKNLVISRVFRFVLILFPVKKGQKTALKRGVENSGVT